MTDEALPKTYNFDLYRGDTRVFTHYFNDDPADWATGIDYVVGEVGADTYTPLTTVTFEDVSYTCTTAHTSGATFDATMWTADPDALGPETDITDWTFLAQYRASTSPDEPVIAVDACVVTDGPGGVMVRTLTHTEAAKLTTTPVYWDLEATKADDVTVKTYLKKDRLKVDGDVSRAA